MSNDQIVVVKRGRAGCITFNRPAVLNALSSGMLEAMQLALETWARDPQIYAVVLDAIGDRVFCAGGDLRELRRMGMEDIASARAFLQLEYSYNWQLETFPKPHVALIDGLVFGGGVGVSLYGTHRVAGPNYAFGMPETGVGFFPDIGASRFLARMPGSIGLYLALTGRSIGAADAYDLGLVTHVIDSVHFSAIKQGLSEGEPVDILLDELHQDPGPGPLKSVRGPLEAVFSASTLPEIFSRAAGFGGDDGGWSAAVLEEMQRRSPMALYVAHQLWKRGHQLSMQDALELEYRVAANMLEEHDFFEGIRALLVDKDKAPRWKPSSIAEIAPSLLAHLFEDVHEGLQLGQRVAAVVA